MAEPMDREPQVNSSFDTFFEALLGIENLSQKRDDAIRNDMCVIEPFGCGRQAKEFRDAASKTEYQITGLCQSCQDNFQLAVQEQS